MRVLIITREIATFQSWSKKSINFTYDRLSHLPPKICELLSFAIQNMHLVACFKKPTNRWKLKNCFCRLGRTYVFFALVLCDCSTTRDQRVSILFNVYFCGIRELALASHFSGYFFICIYIYLRYFCSLVNFNEIIKQIDT